MCGVRPAAARAGVPYTTARGWVRRFWGRAVELGVGFAALAVELGGESLRAPAGAARFALAAIGAAFEAAAGLPGWLALGRWRIASAVSGGRLIAASKSSPYLIVGKRRFMPPTCLAGVTTVSGSGAIILHRRHLRGAGSGFRLAGRYRKG